MLSHMGNTHENYFNPVNFNDQEVKVSRQEPSAPLASEVKLEEKLDCSDENRAIVIDTSNIENTESSDDMNDNIKEILNQTQKFSSSSEINYDERKKVRGLCGFRNQGNTCYMNSILQCLLSNSLLISYFIKDNFLDQLEKNLVQKIFKKYKIDPNKKIKIKEEGMNKLIKNSIAYEFHNLAIGYWNKNRIIIPKTFKTRLGKERSCFQGFNQHDSEEALSLILDKIHEDLSINIKVNLLVITLPDNLKLYLSILKKYKSLINNSSISEDLKKKITKMFILYKRKNINDDLCLKGYIYWKNLISREKSIIQDLYTGLFISTVCCTKCGNKSGSFEPFNTLSLPIPSNQNSSLDSCLKNFSKKEVLDGDNRWYCDICKKKNKAYKVVTIWKLPHNLIIHFKRFKGIQYFSKINTDIDIPLEGIKLGSLLRDGLCENYERDKDVTYDLFSTSNHIGSVNGGHYIAYCKNFINNEWYKFDDKDVYCCEKKSVVEKIKSSYIICLEKRQ